MEKQLKCVSINKLHNGQAQATFHELDADKKIITVVTIHFVNAAEVDEFEHFAPYGMRLAKHSTPVQ